jgi:hypothetical protein
MDCLSCQQLIRIGACADILELPDEHGWQAVHDASGAG